MTRLASALLALPLLLASLSGVDAASQPDITAYLNAHNSFRAKHGAAPLAWNATLANAAQSWVDKCVFKHSGGAVGPYGGTCLAAALSCSVRNIDNLTCFALTFLCIFAGGTSPSRDPRCRHWELRHRGRRQGVD